MTIIGADLSKYDPNEAAGEYPFVILNVEDPQMAVKADIAHAAGATIELYSWVYAGDNGYSVTRSYAAEELLSFDGIRVAHHWLDYEEAGCAPRDLQAASLRVDRAHSPVGTYTYLSVLSSVEAVLVGPLWLAYYPEGYNVVDYYPGMSQAARNLGAVMHQWTSVAPPDGRDLNAVVDEAWHASLGGSTSMPAPTGPEDHGKEADMVIYHNTEVKDPDKDTPTGEWVAVFGSDGPTKISAAAAYGHALAGVPWVDNQSTLGIISIATSLAQSRKDSAFWDERIKK